MSCTLAQQRTYLLVCDESVSEHVLSCWWSYISGRIICSVCHLCIQEWCSALTGWYHLPRCSSSITIKENANYQSASWNEATLVQTHSGCVLCKKKKKKRFCFFISFRLRAPAMTVAVYGVHADCRRQPKGCEQLRKQREFPVDTSQHRDLYGRITSWRECRQRKKKKKVNQANSEAGWQTLCPFVTWRSVENKRSFMESERR